MTIASPDNSGVCERLRLVRETAFGPRGRAAFARALGLSPSTYIYYEKGRVPPADVLARAAEVAGVRLEWLITGRPPRDLSAREVRDARSPNLPAELQAALDRFLELLGTTGPSAGAAGALADLLEQVRSRFPEATGAAPGQQELKQTEGMIPVLGRTAAGLVGTYEELLGEAPAVTVADIARRALGLDVRLRPAVAVESDDPGAETLRESLRDGATLVQLSDPLPSGVIEFIDAPAVRAACPAAFALRVDGESMAPRFLHGDVVLAVPGRQVRSGQAALVQIRGRVGITLKLVRRDGHTVHLVPINETYDTERLECGDIEWMAPVLVALRFRPRGTASDVAEKVL